MEFNIKLIDSYRTLKPATVHVDVFKNADCKVTIEIINEKKWEAIASDAFSALREIRKTTEPLGIKFLIQGSRPNCWPSGMSASMSYGLKIYERSLTDRQTTLVETFNEAPEAQIGSLQDQDQFNEKWRNFLINGG